MIDDHLDARELGQAVLGAPLPITRRRHLEGCSHCLRRKRVLSVVAIAEALREGECPDDVELLLFADRPEGLAAARVRSIESHVESCAFCQSALDPPAKLSLDRPAPATPRAARRPWTRTLVASAAAAILLLVVWQTGRSPMLDAPAIAAPVFQYLAATYDPAQPISDALPARTSLARLAAGAGVPTLSGASDPMIAAIASLEVGLRLSDLGDWQGARVAFEFACDAKPDLPEAQFNLGYACFKLERFDEEIAAYEAALQVRPNYFEARFNLATAVLWDFLRAIPADMDLRKQLLAGVLQQFERAVSIRGDVARGHFGLGTCLVGLAPLEENPKETLERALMAFQMATQLDPDYLAARRGTAICLAALGRFDAAEQELNELIERGYPRIDQVRARMEAVRPD